MRKSLPTGDKIASRTHKKVKKASNEYLPYLPCLKTDRANTGDVTIRCSFGD
ncbi:MAG: hypothetical protein IAC54_05395 [Bacteroidetes bacterium]|uniref:Uncharacterized protein n=1 Tax=Candidatus Caccoplasma merdipullorum TaxID=2840718 RepID=A0A9D9E2E3_9BACT|nr:hypothetical protein [Candidatus Caccoplasma merdipullorum]